MSDYTNAMRALADELDGYTGHGSERAMKLLRAGADEIEAMQEAFQRIHLKLSRHDQTFDDLIKSAGWADDISRRFL